MRNSKAWESDGELVHQILAGSAEHFDLLYEAYFPRVYRFALKRLRDTGEAEDVTQEVFMTLLSALPSYKGESALIVWIFGITRNKVNRRFRGLRPRFESIDSGEAAELARDRARDAVRGADGKAARQRGEPAELRGEDAGEAEAHGLGF